MNTPKIEKRAQIPPSPRSCAVVAQWLLVPVMIFSLIGIARAEIFGIKLLGDTADPVTGTAGEVPVSTWNNVSNGFSGTITANDSTTANLVLSGGAGNALATGWRSAIAASGDGANGSLEDGLMDAGGVGGGAGVGIATISGLAGASYNVYIYCQTDNQRPSNNGDLQPNYNINGTTYYTSVQSPAAYAGLAEGGIYSTNTNIYPTPETPYGDYIAILGVAPTNGVITVTACADQRTYRSPLNGIELVRLQGPAVGVLTASPGTNVYAGTSVTLNPTTVVGTAPLYYQWQTSGGSFTLTNISGATGTNLVVNTKNLATGTYPFDLVVTNSSGASTSSVVTLYISAASVPMVTSGTLATPTNTLAAGQQVTFSASFKGTLPITNQWQANLGSGYTNVPGATGLTLTLDNIQYASAGSYRLAATNSVGGNVSPAVTLTVLNPSLYTETYGIKFLGNSPLDPVTNTAGVVPTAVWNNVTNGYSGNIIANNSATATLALSGTAGAYSSGMANDGANSSLLDGFIDAGQENEGIATISGLTGSDYEVYIYCQTTQERPSNDGDFQPNYTVNGTTYYTSVQAPGPFTGFVEGAMNFDNNPYGGEEPYLPFGDYISVAFVTPSSGTITVTANLDTLTYRSPLNGIELVRMASTTPAITLNIQRSGANVMITWPVAGSSGYFLYSNTALPGPNGTWTYVPTTSSDGVTNTAVVPIAAGNLFFSLRTSN